MLFLLQILLGTLIIAVVLFDVFQSLVVPRWTPRILRLSPLISRNLWRSWCQLGRLLRSNKHREYFLGIFAPLIPMMMLLWWVVTLIFGFGIVLFAMGDQIRPPIADFGSALYLAGTSLLTLGFGDLVAVGFARIVVISAAIVGLSVMALLVSLLFSLYSSFHSREFLVLRLGLRAGEPPSGVALLEMYRHLEMVEELPTLFADWEQWSAEVLQSHLAYPLLSFFRSPRPNLSWISAIGAVLDAATLLLTTVEFVPCGAARLMHGMGSRLVSYLADVFGLPTTSQVGIDFEQFKQARQRLLKAGWSLRDSELAWRDFVQMRSTYASALDALARHFLIAPNPWLSSGPMP